MLEICQPLELRKQRDFVFKDRQQERTAVLTRSHLKALCAFAPYTLYVYYI